MLPLYTLLPVVLVLFSPPHTPASCFAAASDDTLTVGQDLFVGDKLVSRNGKFALGFFTFQSGPGNISKSTDTTDSPRWYLGIWFNKIPVFTTVWVANRDNPIIHTQLNNITQLKISRDGNLAILNGANKSRIWSTAVIVNRTETGKLHNTTAVLLNTGNLVIMEKQNSSNTPVPLWQSFDYPTDIVLSGSKIGWNKVTGLTRQYISRKNLIDPGTGSYCTELQINGALVHRSWNNPSNVFWSWGSVRSSAPNLVPLLQSLLDINPETRGLIRPEYVNNTEEEYYAYSLLNESSHLFYVHDISGQTKLNVWSQDKQSWQKLYTHPISPCTAYAACGPFTVCSGSSKEFCGCMESFSQKSPRDWKLGDHTGGCVRDTPLDCTNKYNKTSSTDIFHPVARVTLPDDPEIIKDATTQSNCKEACLNYCSCTAYSYNNSICSIWHGDLVDVRKNDEIDNYSEDFLYLRLAATDFQKLRNIRKRKPVARIVAVTSIISFGLLVLMLLLVMWRNKSKWHAVVLDNNSRGGVGITTFRYTDLNHATKCFSEKLGEGGFGSVFKGVLSDLTTIAVKRLDGAFQGEKQFRAEVSSIGLIQHINLVRLIGFCSKGDSRLLVYEHMLNGSLDAHLFGSKPSILNWSARYQIAVGVARGLSYLHHSCRERIIHCDIKPQNILLDTAFVPKIADFGMAAFVGRDFSRVLTTLRGTAGYLAPEWLSGVAITPKVDVYSFGMVPLEIISGKRNTSDQVYTSSNNHVACFPVQVILKLQEGNISSLVDPQLDGDFDLEEVERVCKVACWCIQENESDRPTMAELVQVLEGLQELDVPPMPRLLAALTHGTI